MTFNNCSSEGGQNSVIRVVCDVPELYQNKNFAQNILHYQTAKNQMCSAMEYSA